MLNGFELDTPNIAAQATEPSPADGDEHVDADSGDLSLSWQAASGAAAHDVYFGEDPAAVQQATHDSPLFRGTQAGTSYALSGLASIRHYFWRIDEVDDQDVVTRGNLWYCIRAAPFGLSGSRDTVIRNVRVRVGAGMTYDGMGMAGADHSILDHCSISWTIDEAFSSRNAKNITLQRTLISEALNQANHQNYPAGTRHGYAASIGGDVGSFHHNLLAHCEGRNWSLAGGLDAGGNFAGRLDIFNNVVDNWGGRTTDGGSHEVNFVANYYKPGAASRIFVALTANYDNFPGTQQYYMAGNVMPGHFDESNQDAGRATTDPPTTYDTWVNEAFFPSHATLQPVGEAYKDVLSDVGATQPAFDEHDARVVRETLEGTTTYRGSLSDIEGLPDSEADVGGYESYPNETRPETWDSDGDGLPDFWESEFGRNPSSPNGDTSDANLDADGDGYTELEEYLAWMAAPHYFTSLGSNVTVDLEQAFAGYTSGPSYAVSDAVNGTASVSGSTATFEPSRCGMTSFTLRVTDGDGGSMTKTVGVFVDTGGGACP